MSKFSKRGASIVTSTNNLEAKMPATSNGVGVVQNPNHPKKSVYVAYFLWLFGGIFGMHHYYLGRDRHGFVWWTTLGGFGVGWLGEVLKVRKYVLDANEDEKLMAELIRKMQRYPKPPFSINRFTGMLMVGYSWAQMMMNAIPTDVLLGISPRCLNLMIPFAAATGVWCVGNIGREAGSLKWPLIGAYLAYPIRYFIFEDTIWVMAIVVISAFLFDWFSKAWDRRPRRRRRVVKRGLLISSATCLYLCLWGSYLYYRGTVTDSMGDEIPIYEAIHHFFTSPWWLDLKLCLIETYNYAQHHGWYEVWKQIIDLSDPSGEKNAYKVLGVDPEASQQEITSAWRKLSRENHPDKVKDEENRLAAQERFMEVQQAYDLISNSKNRRNRMNKKDNSMPLNF